MEQTGPYQLRLEVSAEGASAENIDQMARKFLSERRDTEVGSVSLAAANERAPLTPGAPARNRGHQG